MTCRRFGLAPNSLERESWQASVVLLMFSLKSTGGIFMKKFGCIFLGLALASAVSMADDCVPPKAPKITEGEESTLEQMLASQKAVKEFQAANLAYMNCLEPMLTAAETAAKEGDEAAIEKYKAIQETYNSAVSREEEVAAKFNTEIRDYKTANPG